VVGAHLVTLSTGRLYVLDLHDGGAVGERDACPTFEGAIGAMGDHLALICDKEIQLFEVPSLALLDRVPLRARAEMAAFSSDHLAIASDDGVVRVIARHDWKPTLELAAGSVDALAVSPDGARLAVARNAEIFVHDHEGPRRVGSTSLPAQALAFAPDGARLFIGAPGGGIVEIGGTDRRLSAAGNVRRALWPRPELLVAAEASGLLLIAPAGGEARSVPGDLGGSSLVGLATADAATICLSDRDGRVACYAEGEATAAVPVEPDARHEQRMGARVRGHEGRELSLTAEPTALLPAEGTAVKVFHYDTSGGRTRWREVARGRVFVVNGREVRVVLERPVESIWGVIEPIALDAAIELAWGPSSPAVEPSSGGLSIPSPDGEDPPDVDDR
jgi:hypothetical protein